MSNNNSPPMVGYRRRLLGINVSTLFTMPGISHDPSPLLTLTSCARGDTICLPPLYACCGPPPVHIHSLHVLCLRRPARLACTMNIYDRQAAAHSGQWHRDWSRRYTLCSEQPTKAAWWPWPLTLKLVSESRVTWATSVPILVFLGLSVLDLAPMYVTDVRQRHTSDKSIA